jgi:hypothetical protein
MLSTPEAMNLGAQKWHELMVHDLTSVVALLDHLARCGCLLREVRARGQTEFAVRWYS